MDFGTDEFIKFCRLVDAVPHIVVNLGVGTAQEAADWVAYCNSSEDTNFGRLRKQNGSSEPYNVKYWEIGNEQWYNTTEMSKKYLLFYDAMKSVDTTIQCMVDGDIWQGKKFFSDIYDVIGDNNQFYSYHTVTYVDPQENCSDDEIFLAVTGSTMYFEAEANTLKDWLVERNLYNKVKLAVTELLAMYSIKPGWIDTNSRNSSLEAGLWMAGTLNAFLRSSDIVNIVEKTFGLNHIRAGYNKKGERIIYPSPIHTVLSFLSRNHGEYLLATEVQCPKYSTRMINGLPQILDAPILDVCVTADENFVYLNVLNRELNNPVEARLDFPFDFIGKNIILYQLNGNFLDFNTPDEPDKINFRKSTSVLNSTLSFPPHSFTMVKIPVDIGLSTDSVNSESLGIILSPNPVYDKLIIQDTSDRNLICTILIINELGISVYENKYNFYDKNNTINIPLSNFAPGIYFCRIISGNYLETKKFVVIR